MHLKIASAPLKSQHDVTLRGALFFDDGNRKNKRASVALRSYQSPKIARFGQRSREDWI